VSLRELKAQERRMWDRSTALDCWWWRGLVGELLTLLEAAQRTMWQEERRMKLVVQPMM
jgi:hypothetical protein